MHRPKHAVGKYTSAIPRIPIKRHITRLVRTKTDSELHAVYCSKHIMEMASRRLTASASARSKELKSTLPEAHSVRCTAQAFE